jgi:hypothetical protein
VELSIKLQEILNEENLTPKLLTWKHSNGTLNREKPKMVWFTITPWGRALPEGSWLSVVHEISCLGNQTFITMLKS